jgi:hypothetical protein
VTRKGRERRGTAGLVSRGRPRELPALPGMPVPGGVEHRKAPERLPDAVGTPRELRVSRRSAGSRTGEGPWGAGPTRHGSPRCRGLKHVRGKRRRKPLRQPGNDVLRRGLQGSGTTAVEPGRAGTSALESVELSTSYSSEFETVEHHGRRGARDAATRFRPPRSKEPGERQPHERQRT